MLTPRTRCACIAVYRLRAGAVVAANNRATAKLKSVRNKGPRAAVEPDVYLDDDTERLDPNTSLQQSEEVPNARIRVHVMLQEGRFDKQLLGLFRPP